MKEARHKVGQKASYVDNGRSDKNRIYGVEAMTKYGMREDFLAFIRAKLNTFRALPTPSYGSGRDEKQISLDLRIEMEAWQLFQALAALAEAEKVKRDIFDQENEKISEELFKALPPVFISILIHDYCEDCSTLLIHIGHKQKKYVQRTAFLALLILVFGLISFVVENILSFIPYQTLDQTLVLVIGIVCSSIGLTLLGVNALLRKYISKIVERQDIFTILEVAQMWIVRIVDEDLKNEMLQKLFMSLLTRKKKIP